MIRSSSIIEFIYIFCTYKLSLGLQQRPKVIQDQFLHCEKSCERHDDYDDDDDDDDDDSEDY